MAICGYTFPDGVVCGQGRGHEADGVPHIPWGEGAAYWAKQRASGWDVLKENLAKEGKTLDYWKEYRDGMDSEETPEENPEQQK